MGIVNWIFSETNLIGFLGFITWKKINMQKIPATVENTIPFVDFFSGV